MHNRVINRTLGRRRVLTTFAACATLTACADTPVKESIAPARPLYWPKPPERARYQYITTIRSSQDIELVNEENSLRALLTGPDNATLEFGKPHSIAAAAGYLYVTDTRRRVVHVFDIPRRRFFQFGFRREGALKRPLGVAVGPKSNVYVVDGEARRVVVYDRFGLYQRFAGNETLLSRPTAVAVSPDGARIYVVDTGGIDSSMHRIVVFSRSGDHLFSFGQRGRQPGEFNLPVGIAVAADGGVYVLDAGNFRVQVFGANGDFRRAWGSVGNGFGQFARPKSIAVDPTGKVYVADAAFGNLQVFDERGRLLLAIGRRGKRDRPGHYALPTGLAADEAGFVYVLDQVFLKIDVIRRLPAA